MIFLGHKNPSILHSAAANVVAVHVLHEVMLDFDVVSVTGASDGGLSNSEVSSTVIQSIDV